jgi:hypothetical protein
VVGVAVVVAVAVGEYSVMNLTGERNQCPTCELYFNSNAAFDKHRTGDHGKNRRCMTVEEMIAKGMAINSRGFWITAKNLNPIWSNK